MIDKLDLEVPRKMSFRKDFARHWNNPNNDKILHKKTGGLYLVRADLRDVGIPAMLSVGHKHHEKLGPKLEVMGAGGMTFSEWAAVHDALFEGEPYDDAILRVDLTADVRGVSVDSFGRAMWCKFKATNQQEYGEFQHRITSVNRFAAQTLYYGRKPRQIRFYDKTRHRQQVLLPQLHREQKKRGEQLSSFFDEYGYEPHEIVTRAERQMGARETSEAWGIHTLGEIHRLAQCDPFERLRFADDAKVTKQLAEVEGARRMLIDLLRERIQADGLDYTKAWSRATFRKADSYRKFWRENEHLIIDTNPLISREKLTSQYQASISEQLAA